MQLANNPQYFSDDSENEISFENLVNVMKKGIDYSNTTTQFYGSANDIINLFNRHSLESNTNYGRKLLANKIPDRYLEEASIRDLSDNIDAMTSTHNKIYSHTSNYEKGSPEVQSHVEIQNKLFEEINKYKDRRNALEASLVNRQDSSINRNEFDTAQEYNHIEDYNSAIDKSFEKSKAYVSDSFSDSENEIIKNSSIAGHITRQLNALNNSSPTFSNSKQKTKLYNALERIYSHKLPIRIKTKVYKELYRYELEGRR